MSEQHQSGDELDDYKEQDRFLPIANVARIMKKALPDNAKIAKEAKETVQECVSEFISFITSEGMSSSLLNLSLSAHASALVVNRVAVEALFVSCGCSFSFLFYPHSFVPSLLLHFTHILTDLLMLLILRN